MMVASLLTSFAFANQISVIWSQGTGDLYRNVDEGGGLLPVNSLFLSYWSPDPTPTGVIQPTVNPFAPNSGDYLLDYVRNTDEGYFEFAGGTYTDTTYNAGGISNFGEGYLFTRVYDYQGTFSHTLGSSTYDFDFTGIGSIWYETSTSTPVVGLSPAPSTIHNPFDGSDVTLSQRYIVPEPGTLALVLIAGAGMAVTLRRRRS